MSIRHALILGAGGMLGADVSRLFAGRGVAVSATDIDECDITDYRQVEELINVTRPEIVINCAAYTFVDLCEDEVQTAWQVNSVGPHNVALVTGALGIPVVYISSDYVFNGSKREPHIETDRCDPLSVYGRTKLAGEVNTWRHNPRHFIVRTGELYGLYGRNFVHTMVVQARKRPRLQVVNDQTVSPTCTADLATQLFELMKTPYFGTYHATSQGWCTWHEFACEIFKTCQQLPRLRDTFMAKGGAVAVDPVKTEAFNLKAPRPAYSVLKNLNLKVRGLDRMPHWRDAVHTYLEALKI